MQKDIDQLCINTIRFLSVDAVERANSGHPGMPMGAAAMAYVLWTKFLKHNPKDPMWIDRDRFVLSAGHGSMLLYSLLYLTGYDLPLEELEHFRQWGSKTAGHPEHQLIPGISITTGPLGQGFASGVGLAIAEANLAATYNKPDYKLIDHYTYAIVGDGDLMEGISSEAASIAGHLNLGKLIYLYDNNHITLSAATDMTFTEDVAKRFESYGWHVQNIDDGNDLDEVDSALRAAQAETQRPSLIIARTHIGYGSPHKQDTWHAHGSPLGQEEVKLTKENLGWPIDPPFIVPAEAVMHFREAVDTGREAETEWKKRFADYAKAFPDFAKEFEQRVQEILPDGWDKAIPDFPADPEGMATRVASGKTLDALAAKIPAIIGGSADLNPSTHTALPELGDFESPTDVPADKQGSVGPGWDYASRNLWFGIREHAMAAILNGLSEHGGFIPYGATFLVFSDYMKPAIRLAALMKAEVIYVFTHDSIALGEDGPTHEPVEHILALRAIPNMIVIRPADANETAQAWKVAVEHKDGPVALILTRQEVPTIDRSQYASADQLTKGAYILSDAPDGKPDIILIASGSEVSLVLEVQKKLASQEIQARVVSMPSWELFDQQPEEYRQAVLPPYIKARLAVEAGSPIGWNKYVGDGGAVFGVDRFGASAPGEVIMREYGFTVDNIWNIALEVLGQEKGEEICASV
ncbi:transketolase [bacterium]|nr:transketolase [bacterium]